MTDQTVRLLSLQLFLEIHLFLFVSKKFFCGGGGGGGSRVCLFRVLDVLFFLLTSVLTAQP